MESKLKFLVILSQKMDENRIKNYFGLAYLSLMLKNYNPLLVSVTTTVYLLRIL